MCRHRMHYFQASLNSLGFRFQITFSHAQAPGPSVLPWLKALCLQKPQRIKCGRKKKRICFRLWGILRPLPFASRRPLQGRKVSGLTALDQRENNFDLMYQQLSALKKGEPVRCLTTNSARTHRGRFFLPKCIWLTGFFSVISVIVLRCWVLDGRIFFGFPAFGSRIFGGGCRHIVDRD